jgi:chitinase
LSASARRRRVTLTWGGATDNVGVAGYRVFRNGVQIVQVSALSFRDAPGTGTFSYTVKAVDAAGNVGPASNTVSAKV